MNNIIILGHLLSTSNNTYHNTNYATRESPRAALEEGEISLYKGTCGKSSLDLLKDSTSLSVVTGEQSPPLPRELRDMAFCT
jgi:hypothetical protein